MGVSSIHSGSGSHVVDLGETDGAQPRRTQSDLNQRLPTLTHEQLTARAQSMPHIDSVPPRSPTPLLLGGSERSTGGQAPSGPGLLQSVRDSSLPQAVGTSVLAGLGAVASPIADVVSFATQALGQASQSARSSSHLQASLQANLAEGDPQLRAHAEVMAYGQHAATHGDRVLPFVHSVMKLAVAGTSMAFGLGRNAGLAGADALARLERGAPQDTGFLSGTPAPARPNDANSLRLGAAAFGQSLVMGSATGGVGNLLGQYVVGPLVNMVPRQFAAIDARAVVPDEMVHLMNQMQPGAGDALRTQAAATQKDAAAIDSNSNVQLGQVSFDLVTAARFGIQGAQPLGVLGQVGAGLSVSATAGAVIGAVMAMRQSVATVEVPDLTALRQAAAQGTPLADVPRQPAPLFYAKHNNPGAAAAQAPERALIGRMADSVQQAFVNGPLMEPPGTGSNRVVQTASNVAASTWRRAVEMGKATVQTAAYTAVSNLAAGATQGDMARRAVLAVGNALGIHAAIPRWFGALAQAIPGGDNAMHAQRLQIADANAARRPPG